MMSILYLHNEIVRNEMKLNKHTEDLMDLSSRDESQKHDAEGREPDIKEHTLYGSLYRKFKSRENKSMMAEVGRKSPEGKAIVTERGHQGVSGMFHLLLWELVTQVSLVGKKALSCTHNSLALFCMNVILYLNKKLIFNKSNLFCKRKNLLKFASFSESV